MYLWDMQQAASHVVQFTTDRTFYGQAGNAYAFLWHGTFQMLAVICLWIVFWYWRRSGAENFKFEVEDQACAIDTRVKPGH
jgi:hypothetical protein